MSQIGRPRMADIRRELRECEKHGLTEFSRYERVRAEGTSVSWRCMVCHNEAQGSGTTHQEHCPEHGLTAHRTYVWKDGSPRTFCMECKRAKARARYVSVAKQPAKRPVCPTCFLEMPNTGICDQCS